MRTDFKSVLDAFKKGEVIIFESADYSRYDSATIYTFQSDDTGDRKQWFLSDEQASDVWKTFFEEI